MYKDAYAHTYAFFLHLAKFKSENVPVTSSYLKNIDSFFMLVLSLACTDIFYILINNFEAQPWGCQCFLPKSDSRFERAGPAQTSNPLQVLLCLTSWTKSSWQGQRFGAPQRSSGHMWDFPGREVTSQAQQWAGEELAATSTVPSSPTQPSPWSFPL